MAEGSCQICCEAFNRSQRRQVTCSFCSALMCAACVQKYLVTVDDPDCMVCKRPWTLDKVEACMTKAWVQGTLKKHRETVLLNRERSLLPATQLEVQRLQRIEQMRAEVKRIERALWDARNSLRRAMRGVSADAEAADVAHRQFVKPCPMPNCRGYLSTQYKCGLCSATVCPDCHEVKQRGQPHECDPGLVASVRAIQQDSKPCPKCGAMIFRIYGCNQMFCTAPGCNTAFCWRTLRILDAQRIHNPHYYEYLQRQRGSAPIGRELDDIPCGGMPTVRSLTNAVLTANGYGIGADRLVREAILARHSELFAMHRFATHVQDVELHRYAAAPDTVNPATNRDLRIRYLTGRISEKRFKEILQQREKQRRKYDAINQVLATVGNVAADMFRMVVIHTASAASVKDSMDNMLALRSYANESLESISRRYSCVVPYLPHNWMPPLHTVRYT
jgi:hypothetical protein